MKLAKQAVVLALLASACATAPLPAPGPNACRTPMPLELRARRIDNRLAVAYANAPPLSVAESERMAELAACAGVSALGVDDGCQREWAEARESGLVERHRIGSGRYSIPAYVASAATKRLGADRTRDLLVALAVSRDAEPELSAIAGTNDLGPLMMMLVSADIEQAMICDSADQAAGRRVGLPYDPAATVPDGP